MRVVSWNINSVRLRLDLVLRLIEERSPDVICLQETKTVDAHFPAGAFTEAGYPHQHIHGMKGYNGVAILSRHPFQAVGTQDWCGRQDCRHAIATLAGGIDIHNIYIPSGGDVPDPDQNEKFAHKLQFLDEMTAWWQAEHASTKPMIAVGDFNIAPLETDVWSHKQMLKVVSHTPIEVDRLNAMQASIDWVDAVRQAIPPEKNLYTWWSYRSRDWSSADKGRRLDHIWVTPPLAGSIARAKVIRDARGWEPKPSDHVPVIVDLDL